MRLHQNLQSRKNTLWGKFQTKKQNYVTKECFYILIKLLEYSNHLEFVHEIAKIIKIWRGFPIILIFFRNKRIDSNRISNRINGSNLLKYSKESMCPLTKSTNNLKCAISLFQSKTYVNIINILLTCNFDSFKKEQIIKAIS